jgi:hypothetical protein
VRAGEGAPQRGFVVGIRGDDLGALRGECACGPAVGLARQRAQREALLRVVEDRLGEAAALGAGGADDGNDGLVRHRHSPAKGDGHS